ncbi:hypothetical protein HAX54_014259 [Datura stramonium]|uniref:Uncharacterized protein n=1 Tax=Datura stramonium TaxID=4076 RepID=A0ABS8TQG2_DATST|nr:hypothetical protein [Datura stramonium]
MSHKKQLLLFLSEIINWVEPEQGNACFDVLHPGAEQVVLVTFEIEVLPRGMPGQCRIVSTQFMDIGALLMFIDTLCSTQFMDIGALLMFIDTLLY